MKNKSSIAVPAKIDATSLGCKPLDGRSIYLDLIHHRNTAGIEKKLKLLGATVEKCFSRDIAFLITNRGSLGDFDGKGLHRSTSRPSAAVGVANTIVSPSSPNLFQLTNSPLCRGLETSPSCSPSTPDGVASRPITRGQAIASKANLTKSYGSMDILACARQWGIRIIHVERAELWIDKEIKKLPKPVSKGKSKSCASVKNLSETFIKIEDVGRRYNPIYGNLASFPEISSSFALGQAIFITPAASAIADVSPLPREKLAAAEACSSVSSDIEFRHPNCGRSKQVNKSPSARQHGKSSAASVAVLASSSFKPPLALPKSIPTKVSDCSVPVMVTCPAGTSTKIGSPPRVADAPHVSRRQGSVAGYCEICRSRFTNLSTHCRSQRHRTSISQPNVYQSLDETIAGCLGIDALQAIVTAESACQTIQSKKLPECSSHAQHQSDDTEPVQVDSSSKEVGTDDYFIELSNFVADSAESHPGVTFPTFDVLKADVLTPAKSDDDDERPVSPVIPITPSGNRKAPTLLRTFENLDISTNAAKSHRLSSGYGTSHSKSPLSMNPAEIKTVSAISPPRDGSAMLNRSSTSAPSCEHSLAAQLSTPTFDWYLNDVSMMDFYFKSSEEGRDLFDGFEPDPDYDHISTLSSLSFTNLSSVSEDLCPPLEVESDDSAEECLSLDAESHRTLFPPIPPCFKLDCVDLDISADEFSISELLQDVQALRPSRISNCAAAEADINQNTTPLKTLPHCEPVLERVDEDITFNLNSPQKCAYVAAVSSASKSAASKKTPQKSDSRSLSSFPVVAMTPLSHRLLASSPPSVNATPGARGGIRKTLAFPGAEIFDASQSTDIIADSPNRHTAGSSSQRVQCLPVVRLSRCDENMSPKNAIN